MSNKMSFSTSWQRALPDFDSTSWCRLEQRATANSLRRLGLDHELLRQCSVTRPCRSGLCAVCMRRLRVRLLNFLEQQNLHLCEWHLVTIRVAGWKVAPGDHSPFGALRDHHLIQNLLTKFRRMRIPGLIVFGSIETVYVTVENVPAPKPFHLHLMISGATDEQIREAIETTIPLDRSDVVPLQIDEVLPGDGHFFRSASYALKQSLLKKSKASADHCGVRHPLKAAERRELISNVGMHGWTGRLILLGIRCDSGTFRPNANLSATAQHANSASLRQMPHRQHRRASRRP